MDPDKQKLEEIYRLTKETNGMLHAMRRNAFWGRIFQFVFWTAILLAPIWFYMTYLNTTVEKMLHTIDQMQGTSAKAQAQFGDLEGLWKKFQSQFSSGSSTSQQ